MRGMYSVPHLPSRAVDDDSFPVFAKAFVIVNPFHMLGSVYNPLCKGLMVRRDTNNFVDSTAILEYWAIPCGVFWLVHVVIVLLVALFLDPTLNVILFSTYRKAMVGIVLSVGLKATLTIMLQWLSNVITQCCTGAGVYVGLWQMK
jgi:hypothetical protein